MKKPAKPRKPRQPRPPKQKPVKVNFPLPPLRSFQSKVAVDLIQKLQMAGTTISRPAASPHIDAMQSFKSPMKILPYPQAGPSIGTVYSRVPKKVELLAKKMLPQSSSVSVHYKPAGSPSKVIIPGTSTIIIRKSAPKGRPIKTKVFTQMNRSQPLLYKGAHLPHLQKTFPNATFSQIQQKQQIMRGTKLDGSGEIVCTPDLQSILASVAAYESATTSAKTTTTTTTTTSNGVSAEILNADLTPEPPTSPQPQEDDSLSEASDDLEPHLSPPTLQDQTEECAVTDKNTDDEGEMPTLESSTEDHFHPLISSVESYHHHHHHTATPLQIPSRETVTAFIEKLESGAVDHSGNTSPPQQQQQEQELQEYDSTLRPQLESYPFSPTQEREEEKDHHLQHQDAALLEHQHHQHHHSTSPSHQDMLINPQYPQTYSTQPQPTSPPMHSEVTVPTYPQPSIPIPMHSQIGELPQSQSLPHPHTDPHLPPTMESPFTLHHHQSPLPTSPLTSHSPLAHMVSPLHTSLTPPHPQLLPQPETHTMAHLQSQLHPSIPLSSHQSLHMSLPLQPPILPQQTPHHTVSSQMSFLSSDIPEASNPPQPRFSHSPESQAVSR